MLSKARIGTHALHPMLIVVPAGAFVMALVFDLVYLATRAELWWNAMLPLLLVGVVGAIVAAIPGFIDYFTVVPRQNANRPATIHMAGNLIVVLLFAWNAGLRWATPQPPVEGLYAGFWLTLVGVAILGVTGWMGWALVQKYHVGVAETPVAGPARPGAEPPRREAAD